MITRMTGRLARVLDDEIRLEVGPFEYQLLISEAVRRQVLPQLGQEIALHISEYLEGNPSGNRFIPRRIGFSTEAELDFFDLFCTVEKIGVKKALKAMARPVREIADAINRQDARWLSTLPGIGPRTAEQIITTLKRKVAPFLMVATPASASETETAVVAPATKSTGRKKVEAPAAIAAPAPPNLTDDIYRMLISLGLSPAEARMKLDVFLLSGVRVQTVEEAIPHIFNRGKGQE